jgi:Sigma-70, region 4
MAPDPAWTVALGTRHTDARMRPTRPARDVGGFAYAWALRVGVARGSRQSNPVGTVGARTAGDRVACGEQPAGCGSSRKRLGPEIMGKRDDNQARDKLLAAERRLVEAQDAVHAAFAELLEGRSYSEVAKLLGVSKAAIGNRVARARGSGRLPT